MHHKIWMNVVKMLIHDQSLKAASYWLQKQTVILPKDVQIQDTAGTLQSKHAAVKTALYGFMNSFYSICLFYGMSIWFVYHCDIDCFLFKP